jgi:predicted RNase H-like HicB family nuclease/bifunctional DNA-binding transcriptional regulator/antitoxin component of YhaV-PrlF toxin-antitoxin module
MSSFVVSMDDTGRVAIPEELRREAGIEPGVPLKISCRDGCIEIEPAPREVRIVQKGRLPVAVPVEPGPVLSAEAVERTREQVRDRDMPQRFHVLLEWDPEAGAWVTYVPALNGLSTFGETMEEALAKTGEAILGYSEAAMSVPDLVEQRPFRQGAEPLSQDQAEAALRDLLSSREEP